jgi:hypothetical protein
MKAKYVLVLVTAVTFFFVPRTIFGQTPNLGSAANFVLFSPVGAIGNTAISQITGNIGTNSGAITGFGNVDGVTHNADATTAQAAIDLQAAWHYLANLTPTLVHGPVLGGGEILFAGVDTIAAAGSIVGSLTLDAQGNPNAVFVIKTGGALTTAALATVNLINGAVACNVYWVAEGAISMATYTVMRGTLIAHNGAIDMGAGGTIEGRALSTTGAVSVYGTLAYLPLGCSIPVLTGPVAPNLATVACYTVFSSNGTVSNSATTYVTGDVGTNVDSTTGYNPMTTIGTVHPRPDLSTAQAAIDLQNVYTYLDTLKYNIQLMFPAQFGNSLILTPHIYWLNAATVFTDTLFLNAEGNPDAVFVFQINGALTTSAYSMVSLINGAQAKNVYWEVQGAVTINSNSNFSGTIVSNDGAIVLSTGDTLAGRALTTTGSVNSTLIIANNAYGGYCSNILPVNLLSFSANCSNRYEELKWSTTTETDNKYFTVERSADGKGWQSVGSVQGAGNSAVSRAYSFSDNTPNPSIAYYRLMLTDFAGNESYSSVVNAGNCEAIAGDNLVLYPNPSSGKFEILFTGDKSQVYSTEIYNSVGERVCMFNGFKSAFDLYNQASGVYFIQLHLQSKNLNQEVVVQK